MTRDRRRDGEVRARLEAAGGLEAPAPDPAFVDGLEARLRAGAATAGDTRRRRWWAPVPRSALLARPLLATLGAAALVVVVAVAALLAPDADREPLAVADLELTAATDATVTLPDGREVRARPGLDLPEGAVVRTGPAGRVVAGDDTLGADSEAVVTGGRLVPVREPRGDGSGALVHPPTTVPPPVGDLLPGEDRGSSTSTTTTTRPSTATTARPSGGEERLELRCHGRARGDRGMVACAWTESAHPRFAAYRLVRVAPGDRHVVAVVRERDRTGQVDDAVRPGTAYRYLVEVLDRAGAVVGRGGPAEVGWAEGGSGHDGGRSDTGSFDTASG